MQLFSRNKALAALSLGALAALGACGDDVTVPAPVNPPVVISITPPSASMNIGESLNFAVQISGGSTTAAPSLASCTSSNAAVATAAVQGSACRVTAVAAGNATVTAAASTGQVAAASVTVSPAAPAISNLQLQPGVANIGATQSFVLTPTITRVNNAAVTWAVSSSNTAIASVGTPNTTSGATTITGVAPGTAVITVTATSGAVSLTQAMTVQVSALPQGISALQVTPQALPLAVGSTATVTAIPTVATGAGATQVTFGTTNTTIISLSNTNAQDFAGTPLSAVVTAVAPGSAIVTVTATSAASANFAASTVTQLVNVTVSPTANVTIRAINQGPIVTSYAGDNGVGTGFGIIESTNDQVNQPVDINRVRDQIQVITNLQPNGQRVDSVVAFIANADGTNRRPAARQLYSNGTANAGDITLFVNTADFTVDFAAGTADVFYPNGQKIISVSVFTTNAANEAIEIQNASNNRQTVNFDNLDGYAGQYRNPTRVAQGGTPNTNLNWWGGPGANGEGNVTIVPVYYTAGRTLRVFEVGMRQGITSTSAICGDDRVEFAGPANPTPGALPYRTTYGANAPELEDEDATDMYLDCSGYEHPAVQAQNFAGVVSAIDNDNNPAPLVTRVDGFRRSAAVARPVANRLDYAGPSTETPDIRRARPAVTGWVNAAFDFQANTDASTDGGVGVKANSRAWAYTGCDAEAAAMPNATGADIPECSGDATGGWDNGEGETRGPYTVAYTELDRLDNSSTSDDSWKFGVDKTVPQIRFSTGSPSDTSTASSAGTFQAEFLDERAGFISTDDNGAPVKGAPSTAPSTISVGSVVTNSLTGAEYPWDRSQYHVLVHAAGFLPAANFATRSQCLVPNPSTTPAWRLTAALTAASTTIAFPNATFLSNPGCALVPARNTQGGNVGDGYVSGQAVTLPDEGIFRYSTLVYDKAGNVSATLSRARVFDNTAANFSALNTPLSVALGGTATFPATYEDRVEVRAATLKLVYNGTNVSLTQQGTNGATVSIAATDTLVYPQTLIDARFNDVVNAPNTTNLTTPYGSPFVTSIEFTSAGGGIVSGNNGTKASLASGTMWDAFNRQDALGAAGTPRTAAINGSALANPVGFAAWVADNPTRGFSSFSVLPTLAASFNAASGLKAQVQATTNTINPPFARVDFYRRGTVDTSFSFTSSSTLQYIGSSTSAVSADEGTTRYWTYVAPATLASLSNNFSTANSAVGPADAIIAIGVRSSGEALASQQTVIGGGVNLTYAGISGFTRTTRFAVGSTTTVDRTTAGIFAAPAATWTITPQTATVPLSVCASGLATGSVTAASSGTIAGNGTVSGFVTTNTSVQTATVTWSCVVTP